MQLGEGQTFFLSLLGLDCSRLEIILMPKRQSFGGGQLCSPTQSRRREFSACPVELDRPGFQCSRAAGWCGALGKFLAFSQPDFPRLWIGAVKENSVNAFIQRGWFLACHMEAIKVFFNR